MNRGMKQAFLSCMDHLYPDGLPSESSHQLRDLIRVFSMGWCESLIAQGLDDEVEKWTEEFKPIADLNWWPDDTWKWF